MGCLDASRTFVHLLVFDWAYDFRKPGKPPGQIELVHEKVEKRKEKKVKDKKLDVIVP